MSVEHLKDEFTANNYNPPAPPPLPKPTDAVPIQKAKETVPPPPPKLKRTDSLKSNMTYVDEFKSVFSTLKLKKRSDLSIKKTPDVFIDLRSTSQDVQNWLLAKGFKEEVRDKLKKYDGSEVFLFEKEHCTKLCGDEDGKRLYSQLLLQKNSCHVSILIGLRCITFKRPMVVFGFSTTP